MERGEDNPAQPEPEPTYLMKQQYRELYETYYPLAWGVWKAK